MKIIDVAEPDRINKKPDKIIQVVQNGKIIQEGFQIQVIDLRLYIQHTDKNLGVFSVITAFVQTNKGSIEMLYDEGYHGETSLEDSVKFLTENLGLSSLILRSIISIKNKL